MIHRIPIPPNWFCKRHMFPVKIAVFFLRVQLFLSTIEVFIKNSHTSQVDPPIILFGTIKPSMLVCISVSFHIWHGKFGNLLGLFPIFELWAACLGGGRGQVGCTVLQNIPFYRRWILCRDMFIGVIRWFIWSMFSPLPCRNNTHKCFASSYINYLFCFFNKYFCLALQVSIFAFPVQNVTLSVLPFLILYLAYKLNI